MTNDRGHHLDYRMVEEAIIAPKRCPGYIGIIRCFVDLLSLHHTRTNTLSFDSRNYFGSRTGSTILATARVIAWIIVIGLIMISLAPAPLRPGTGVSHNLEHFGSFLIAGIIWRLAYADRLVLWLGTMPVFAGGVELLQIFVPGRHARLSDFAVDALARLWPKFEWVSDRSRHKTRGASISLRSRPSRDSKKNRRRIYLPRKCALPRVIQIGQSRA